MCLHQTPGRRRSEGPRDVGSPIDSRHKASPSALDSPRVSFRSTVAALVSREPAEEGNPLRDLRLDTRAPVLAAGDHDDRHGPSGLRHLGRALRVSHLADHVAVGCDPLRDDSADQPIFRDDVQPEQAAECARAPVEQCLTLRPEFRSRFVKCTGVTRQGIRRQRCRSQRGGPSPRRRSPPRRGTGRCEHALGSIVASVAIAYLLGALGH
jgi:hypothetical protein